MTSAPEWLICCHIDNKYPCLWGLCWLAIPENWFHFPSTPFVGVICQWVVASEDSLFPHRQSSGQWSLHFPNRQATEGPSQLCASRDQGRESSSSHLVGWQEVGRTGGRHLWPGKWFLTFVFWPQSWEQVPAPVFWMCGAVFGPRQFPMSDLEKDLFAEFSVQLRWLAAIFIRDSWQQKEFELNWVWKKLLGIFYFWSQLVAWEPSWRWVWMRTFYLFLNINITHSAKFRRYKRVSDGK